MSDPHAVVTVAHLEYVAARTPGDDPFMRALKDAARAANIPEIWVAPEQASFMQIILKATGAREVVEVGTLAGYSAIALARALPAGCGRVRTLEIHPRHAAFARAWIARSDVAGSVEVLEGDARDLLGTFAAGSVDAMFIDADKEGYPAYLDHACRLLRPGGVVMVDNAFAFGKLMDGGQDDPDVPHLRAFNDHMAAHPGFHGIIVPLGDGCWLGVKR